MAEADRTRDARNQAAAIVPIRDTTIADAKVLDLDQIMSEGFDIEEFLGPHATDRIDAISPYISKEESKASLVLDEYMKQSGVALPGQRAARVSTSRYMATPSIATDAGILGSWREGWNNGELITRVAEIRLLEQRGYITPDMADAHVARVKAQMTNTTPSGWMASVSKSTAGLLPFMWEATKAGIVSGAEFGTIVGGAAFAGALAVGQTPPLLATPEEPLTAPAAYVGGFIAGWGPGFIAGSAVKAGELEGGLFIDEVLSMRDENGREIDRQLAYRAAYPVMVINGMLEAVQITDIVKTIPGGKKLLGKATRGTIKALVKNRRIQAVLARGAARYATNLGVETATEIAQEIDTIVMGEFTKQLSNQLDDTDFSAITKNQFSNRVVETAKESLKGFAVIAAPGNIITTVGDLIATMPVLEKTVEGVIQPVTRISRLLPGARIQSRVNVAEILTRRTSSTTLSSFTDLLIAEAAQTELSAEEITGFVRQFEEARTIAQDNLTATGQEIVVRPPSNLQLLAQAEELEITTSDIKGLFSLQAVQRDNARALLERRIAKATKPKRKLGVLQLRKQARGLGVDTSDIKGKGAAASIEARIVEAQAARPLQERGRAPLTEEEKFQLAQTEATLRASEPFSVTPNLYIGNVTQRMKKVFAEALETTPERIHGFVEEGVPVKRTKVELSVGEARGLLFTLEESLQERLDNNKIQTHPQMAQANADWGDIKTLREVLGLPKIKRPFRVIVAPKTKIVTILNVKERIRKTVTPSAGDIVLTTQIDRLNNVMRRVARATTEGFKLGKKEQREAFAELQYLRKQAALRTRLVDRIQRPPAKAMDFFYREAIEDLQGQIDFTATGAERQASKQSLRDLIIRNPEAAEDIPSELLTTLDQTDIADLTYANLTTINQEIQRLRKLGITKSKAIRSQRSKARNALASKLTAITAKAKVPRILKGIRTAVQAFGLGPPRIFDMLDGGQNFKGPNYDFYYWTTNQNVDAETLNSTTRYRTGLNRMHDLGIRARDLNTKREVGGLNLSVDTLLSIYTGWLNPASQAALRHGGFTARVKGQDTIIRVTDELHRQAVEALTPAEKAWGDTIIAEYGEHYDRLRTTTIRAENRDLGNEINYTPIRHTDIDYQSTEQEVLDELAERNFYRSVGVQKGFTIDRQNIPPEYQKPVKVGLTKLWTNQIRKQEHYINHALHLKDMKAVANDMRPTIRERFGDPIMKSVDSFIDSVANPDFYRAFNEIENLSRLLRQHTVIAYIGFNLITVMKQVPSIALYWAKSSIGDVLISTAVALRNPRQAYNNALAIHPQLSDRAIEREMVEMQQQDPTGYNKIIRTIGRTALLGIVAMDVTVKTIGINAVFAKEVRHGKSPQAAAKSASQTTLLTQPGFSPKDRARLYSTNEVLNWMTQFTNQLNKLYNVATHDIPVAFRNRHYMDAARSAFALGVMAILIRMISTGEAPEDAEDAALALSEQAIASVPIAGPTAASTLKGYRPSTIPPLKAISGAVLAGKAIATGELDKAIRALWEPIAVTLGLPYQGFRNVKKISEKVTEEE